MLTLQKFKKIVNVIRAVGQDSKEDKEISQMHYKILLLWTKLFAAPQHKNSEKETIIPKRIEHTRQTTHVFHLLLEL